MEIYDWRYDAACREIGGDSWYPEDGERPGLARRICMGCPVRSECLADALANASTYGRFGVWGGTTERERRLMVRASKAVA